MRNGISCREMNLLLQALRAFFSEEPHGLQSAATTAPLDWAAFTRVAEHHSVMPLVAYALRQYGSRSLPPEWSDQFHRRLLLAGRRNLIFIAEWNRILQALIRADIRAITVKGPALALLAYPNFALREFTDLDLLIHSSDFSKARDVLVSEGYRLNSPIRSDASAALLCSRNRQLDFVHHQQPIRVDLHWGALHEMFSFQLPVDLLFKSARVEYHDAIEFLTLSPENLLLYLCAHGTKHCWLNLRWLCDIACHLRRSHDLNWELCLHTADASNCTLVLRHSLLLVHHILKIGLPPSVASYCSCAKSQTLADSATSFLFLGDRDLDRAQELLFHLQFATGWHDRARFLFERLFVSDEPVLHQRLPGSMGFLSYAVKPMRFLFDRIRNVYG